MLQLEVSRTRLVCLQNKILKPSMEDDLQWKTTFNGKQPLIEDDICRKTAFNGRQNLVEDDLCRKTTFDGRKMTSKI